MKFLVLLVLFYSVSALACWRLEGDLTFNDDKLHIDQKVEHDRTYSYQVGNYIVDFKVPTDHETKGISIKINEKKGNSLTEVSNPRIIMHGGTARVTSRNEKTGFASNIELKLTHI